MKKYYSDEVDECYFCDTKTKNACPKCGMPYCEECFEKIKGRCKHCTGDGYD